MSSGSSASGRDEWVPHTHVPTPATRCLGSELVNSVSKLCLSLIPHSDFPFAPQFLVAALPLRILSHTPDSSTHIRPRRAPCAHFPDGAFRAAPGLLASFPQIIIRS